jgi:DNA-binding NtrC family response regulator
LLWKSISYPDPGSGIAAGTGIGRDADNVPALGTALVVEGHAQVREMLGRLLRSAGYRVIAAAKVGAIADLLVGEALATCIIEIATDDRGAGMRLGRVIREADAAVPILHITGLEPADLPELGEPDPMTRYLHKPFGVRAMLDVLGRMAGKAG